MVPLLSHRSGALTRPAVCGILKHSLSVLLHFGLRTKRDAEVARFVFRDCNVQDAGARSRRLSISNSATLVAMAAAGAFENRGLVATDTNGR